jgi:hypothetical protein
VLEIEFRVTAPFAYGELPLPPPPRVIQYFEVPRYVFEAHPVQNRTAAGDILGGHYPNTFQVTSCTDCLPSISRLPIQ